jgi:hypothetical protein
MGDRYRHYTKGNAFGGNSISRILFSYLKTNLDSGKTILELGSGWGTGELMKHWNVWSIEHNTKWFKKYNPQSLLVGIDKRGEEGWYKHDVLKKALEGLEYDLLLVDGPWYGRQNFPDHLDLFDTRVPIVFDDVRRAKGIYTIKTVSTMIGRPYVIHGHTHSMFGVIP